MKKYIGTKEVKAMPMNLGEYNQYRGWDIPEDEDPATEGYLVEYINGGGPNHPSHKGYISWSPKEVFEESYFETSGMTFGQAIEAAKLGYRIAREGWNGRGMWVIYNPESDGKVIDMAPGSVYESHGISHAEILPHFDMYTINAEGRRAMLPGWLASQTDMISDDWGVVLGIDMPSDS